MNNNIAQFHDDILKVIWSMPADQTSAQSYQDLIRHSITFPNETPFAWFMKGPIREILTDPITDKLQRKFTGRSQLKLKTEIKEISIDKIGNRVLVKYETEAKSESELFRHVVVATQCKSAARLVFSPKTKENVVSHAPSLARLREGVAGRIPVVYLYFTNTFLESERATRSKFPEELIGFRKISVGAAPSEKDSMENEYDISILDIKKLWGENLKNAKDGEPVLVVAASHAAAIQAPGPDEGLADGEDQGFAMIRRLGQYFPFINIGDSWGVGGDIDWTRTRVITNNEHLLFLNGAGTDAWRPRAKMDGLDNVFFAGDYCRTDVDMATVEAAVQSGVLAARAVQERAPRGSQICLQPHDIYASRPLLLVKMLASPAAFAASLSESYDNAAGDPVEALKFPCVVAVQAAAYWVDWLRSAMLFWATFLPDEQWSASGAPLVENVADHDNRIGLTQWALNTVLAFMVEGPSLAPDPGEAAAEALYSAWYWMVGRILFPHIRGTLRDPKTKPARTSTPSARAAAPANTWSELVREALGVTQITPKGLGDTAFGVATTVVSALQIAAKTPSAKRQAVSTAIEAEGLRFSEALKSAIKAGQEARKDRAMSYRIYDAPYSLN